MQMPTFDLLNSEHLKIADILKFDNSYSWATKKKLLYQIDVMPPFSDAMTPDDESIPPLHDSDSFQASGNSSVYSLVPENFEDEIRWISNEWNFDIFSFDHRHHVSSIISFIGIILLDFPGSDTWNDLRNIKVMLSNFEIFKVTLKISRSLWHF